MKKISRSDLKGLLEFPVYSQENLRKIVGGTTNAVQGWAFSDNLGNFMWFSSYDAFNSSYASYIENGYVDHSSSGYFHLSNGNGGFYDYYNSVYGFGENEVPPPASQMCFFNALSKVTGKSVAELFTQYKNSGNAFNGGFGVYLDQAAAFLTNNNYGSFIPNSQFTNRLNDRDTVVVGLSTVDSNGSATTTHAVMIEQDCGNYYRCKDATSDQVYSVEKTKLYQGGGFAIRK